MKFTSALGQKICEQTTNSSIGLRHICKDLNVPYSTVTSWIYDEDHELHDNYVNAKEMQLYFLAEEILQIADDSTNDYMTVVSKNGKTKQVLNREAIARSRLRIQARTTLIAKLSPILRVGRHNRRGKYRYELLQNEDPVSEEDDQDTPPPAAKSQKIAVKKENRATKKIPSSSPKNDLKPAPVAPPSPEPVHIVYPSNRTIPRHNSMFSQEDIDNAERFR